MLAALIRKVFNVQEEEPGTIEQLGVFTGDKAEALECGKAWLALRYQHVDGAPAGYLELRKRS
jgi:hypothetical protein